MRNKELFEIYATELAIMQQSIEDFPE